MAARPFGVSRCCRRLVGDNCSGRRQRNKYCDFQFTRDRRGELNEEAGVFREVLLGAARRQIAADVPVMTYLSGGIRQFVAGFGVRTIDSNVRAYSCIFNLADVGDDGSSMSANIRARWRRRFQSSGSSSKSLRTH